MPRLLRSLAVRLHALVRRGAAEAELDEELRYHLEREVERNLAHGMTPAAARLAARRAFGNVEHYKEEVRDDWGVRWLEQLAQDVRFAWRSFRAAPAFALTVVATIALGLGLNAAVFTLFDAYVLRPVAVRDPYALYELALVDRSGRWYRLDAAQRRSLAEQPMLAETFAWHPAFARVQRAPAFGLLVSGGYFHALGAAAEIGRLIEPGDDVAPGSAPVVVLSWQLWRNRFGGDSAVVGRRIVLRGHPFEVVGVTSRRFPGLGSMPPDFYAPLAMASAILDDGAPQPAAPPTVHGAFRLVPGVGEPAARAALSTWARRVTAERPDSTRAVRVELMSLASALPLTPETIAVFAPLFVAFGLVLLLACANVANVMLARGVARQREIGIRLALGAGRRRLVRQLLTESVLLALPAALLGFAISRWTIAGGVRAMFASVPAEFAPYLRVIPLAPDARVFGFMLVAALASAVLFGLVPALQATRPSIVRASRGDFDTAFRPQRLRRGLVVAQVTVSTLLLVVTGVLLRATMAARDAATGMRTSDVVELQVAEGARPRVLERLRADPIVRTIALSSSTPLDGVYPSRAMRALGRDTLAEVAFDFVSAEYFDALGIGLVAGRTFSAGEVADGDPVAMVSEAAAARLWPGRDPLGEVVELATPASLGPLTRARRTRVIGVARNAVSGWIGTGIERPLVYFPTGRDVGQLRVIVRVAGDAAHARSSIDQTLSALVPGSVEDVHTLDDYLALQVYPFRAAYWVASALGAVALLLTIAGVYGMLSYVVAQRTREIGIRMALGAGLERVIALVLRESLALAALGIVTGVALAGLASWGLGSLLVIVDPFDLAGYLGGAVTVLVACTAAAYAPARRAAGVDPGVVLKEL